jgi:hypothetical protein
MNRGERFNDGFQRFFFFPEILRALGVFPDFRVFQFGVDLFQFLRFQIEVKDTPGDLARARSDQRAGR